LNVSVSVKDSEVMLINTEINTVKKLPSALTSPSFQSRDVRWFRIFFGSQSHSGCEIKEQDSISPWQLILLSNVLENH
jgi:hypothetical protein